MPPETLHDRSSDDKLRRRFLAVWTWVGAIILVVVSVYLINILGMPLGILVWSAIFVLILAGPVNYLEKRGIPRALGTAISYVLMAVVLTAIALLLFSPGMGINDQFNELADNLPGYVESLYAWAVGVYDQYADVLQNDAVRQWLSSVAASLGAWAQTLASESASGVVAAGTSIANTLICIAFALVIAFWVLMDLPRLGVEVKRLIGEKHAEEAQMFRLTLTRVMGGYIKATLIQCAIIGIGCSILYIAVGVPSPIALGTITGLLNIIPIIGPWLGAILASLTCLFTSVFKAIVVLVGAVIITQAVYMFLQPKLMGNSVDIYPALTFVAVMTGSAVGYAMGGMTGSFIGALFAIPAVAAIKSVFVYYFERNTGRRIVSKSGVLFKGVTEGDESTVDPMADATAMAPAVEVQLPVTLPVPPALGKQKEDTCAEAAPEDTDEKI